MKTNILKRIALSSCVLASLGLASCDDFLTITPTNSIVEEEFWQDRNDIENVVGACYKRLVDNDVLSKYIQWGEMRSDNFELATGVNNTSYRNLMNANLLPTDGIFGWTPFYNTINYCNKVLVHGPEVLEIDESFSYGDWEPIRAEVIALRAYCHFWLVRTFGEVPYVTQDYNNDQQELKLPQSTQLQVLDSIILDLESVKNVAMNDYNDNVMNKGRITRKAVYTLLADAYLWRASYKAGNNQPFKVEGLERPAEEYTTTAEHDYQKSIECCDEVIRIMKEEKLKSLGQQGGYLGENFEVTIEDLLISNSSKESNSLSTSTGAYSSIFGQKNSSESIFELQVEGTSYSNSMVTGMFWNIKNAKQGTLNCSNNLFSGSDETPNKTLPTNVFTKTDMRKWETIRYEKQGQVSLPIVKYITKSVVQNVGVSSTLSDNTNEGLTVSYQNRPTACDANWIVYRISDVMLMKSEAMSQLYDDEEHLTEAFNLCRYIYKRSNPNAYSNTPTGDSLLVETFLSPEGIESLVMAERQREFVAEGKRWFDLVRYALRRGGTQDMLTMLTRKYASDNKKAIEAKLSTIQSLFSPINKDEIKSNGLLRQNEVWATDESTSKTDEL